MEWLTKIEQKEFCFSKIKYVGTYYEYTNKKHPKKSSISGILFSLLLINDHK